MSELQGTSHDSQPFIPSLPSSQFPPLKATNVSPPAPISLLEPFPLIKANPLAEVPEKFVSSTLPNVQKTVVDESYVPEPVPPAPQLSPLPQVLAPGNPGQYIVAQPPGNGTFSGVILQATPPLSPVAVPMQRPAQFQPNYYTVSNNNL